MAKYKPWDNKQRLMLPISLQDQIVPGTLEYTISKLFKKRCLTIKGAMFE
jgi:hypothetical protein